ncbi:MAG: MBL fold metallo-hydrolase [Eubacteriales bacterium]
MKIKTIGLSSMATNCYIIYDEKTEEAIIIDPAEDNNNTIEKKISTFKINPKAILLTHGHFDHIGSVDRLKKEYDIPVYASAFEKDMMEDSKKNLSKYFIGVEITANANKVIKDGDVLSIGTFNLKCIEVPGHTQESICFYMEEGYLFSGDTLFRNSIGRSDLFEGPADTLAKNIKNKLLILPEETKVFPGHGFTTTIKQEKENNMFLKDVFE